MSKSLSCWVVPVHERSRSRAAPHSCECLTLSVRSHLPFVFCFLLRAAFARFSTHQHPTNVVTLHLPYPTQGPTPWPRKTPRNASRLACSHKSAASTRSHLAPPPLAPHPLAHRPLTLHQPSLLKIRRSHTLPLCEHSSALSIRGPRPPTSRSLAPITAPLAVHPLAQSPLALSRLAQSPLTQSPMAPRPPTPSCKSARPTRCLERLLKRRRGK